MQCWLSVERWQECGGLDVLTLADRECYAGLDLGVTGDMSALALVFINNDGGFDVTARFWVPEDGRWQSEQRNHELYREWAPPRTPQVHAGRSDRLRSGGA